MNDEIPTGKNCSGMEFYCPFYRNNEGIKTCAFFEDADLLEDDLKGDAIKCKECFEQYPHGGLIHIQKVDEYK